MNSFIKGAILAMAMLGLSLPAVASIEQECSGNNQHAVEVCPAIYQIRAELDEFRPPQPFLQTQLIELAGPNLDFDAPQGSTGSSSNPCAGKSGMELVNCLQQR
jgi:hypothetical protein